jgi:hypothetical protein
MEHAYLYESHSAARYGIVSCKRACRVTPKWNIMDHEAGYNKISDKDKEPLCLIKHQAMNDV